jgi:chemotaxis protein MotB
LVFRSHLSSWALVLALLFISSLGLTAQQTNRIPLVNEHQPLNWEQISLELLVQEVEAAAVEEQLVDFSVEVQDNTISIVYRDLQFPPDSPEITQETREKIEGLARVIQRFANRQLQVEGHTAAVPGDDDDGTVLSGQRANAVADTIAGTGLFDRARIAAFGRGEFQPIADNDTPEGRALNRW